MATKTLRFWAQAAGAKAPALQALGAQADHAVSGLSTDSRTITSGQIFVALRGENFDGHAFAKAALTRGAAAVVIDAQGQKNHGIGAEQAIVVPDTLVAFGEMARAYRLTSSAKFVAITGSNGKTTTKELMAAALLGHGVVHKTHGNLNNLVGVPKTLLDLPEQAAAAVIEMGMNAPGEIGRLTRLVVPHVGIITGVAAAHLEGLGTLERVARAKCELIDAMPEDGIVVLNADDDVLMACAEPKLQGRRVLRYGSREGCDVQLVAAISHASSAKHAMSYPRCAMTLQIDGRRLIGTLPLVGYHNARNAAGAVAAAIALGNSPDAVLARFEHVTIPGSRLRLVEVPQAGVWLLDDAYNANPGSVRAAIDTLAEVAGRRRRVAILGDMLELGPNAGALHREIGAHAAKSGISYILCIGTFAEETAAGARSQGAHHVISCADVDASWQHIALNLQQGDWVLVKGSRGARLERIVDALVAGQVITYNAALESGKTNPHYARPVQKTPPR